MSSHNFQQFQIGRLATRPFLGGPGGGIRSFVRMSHISTLNVCPSLHNSHPKLHTFFSHLFFSGVVRAFCSGQDSSSNDVRVVYMRIVVMRNAEWRSDDDKICRNCVAFASSFAKSVDGGLGHVESRRNSTVFLVCGNLLTFSSHSGVNQNTE